jgi:hypothetical protein
MLETKVRDRIKKYLKDKFGATVHVYHGSYAGETGHSDLYGTLPGMFDGEQIGRAFFFEVKSPDARIDPVREQYQRLFMYSEQLNGAKVGFVTCVEDVEKILLHNEDLLWSRTKTTKPGTLKKLSK